ncbi:MAG: PIG-L family deacetylase [Acidobacteria bacterium]|nr:PIG-L family deacetylase [Acidobacteriota bacterium]
MTASVLALITLLAFVAPVYPAPRAAQDAADRAELYQSLLDLTNPWTVMCVAAHPDDEDGATLTILRRKYGAHTVSLFSTFGEGGQNAIGPELYEELGAIRARETLKAAEIQGSEAHFLGLRDFGFSKSAEEAFRFWGHDEALRRMVFEIRRLRPDVIITNHDTTGGHGHHQATGRLVLEAFDAAADPKRFPEQLKEADVWQVQRLFVRMSYEGGAATKALDEEAVRAGKVVTVNRNEQDPVRGMTYAEQALHALQQHASQGPWPQTLPKDGWPPIRYRLAREAKGAAPLPSNPNTVLDGLRLPETVAPLLAPPTIEGKPLTDFVSQPERVFAALKNDFGRRKIRSDQFAEVDKTPYFRLMAERFNHALAATSGLRLTLTSSEAALIPDSATAFRLQVANNGERAAKVRYVRFPDRKGVKESTESVVIKPHSQSAFDLPKFNTPANAKSNLPHAEHLYDGTLFGEELRAIVELEVDDQSFEIPVSTQLDIAPPVEIAGIAPSPYVFTPANLNQPLTFRVRLVNHQDKPFKGAFMILGQAGEGGEVGPDISLAAHETREFTLRSNIIPVDTPDEQRTPRASFGKAIFQVHPNDSAKVITQREARIVYSDARVAPGLRVGYVRSTDDTLRNALNALGVEAQELQAEEIAAADLSKLDTIIIDNRGYQLHPELIAANARLLDFAKNGGTLIVFYHKTNEWNPDAAKNRPQLAPLPITLGNERVTDENAAVAFTEPQHPLLNSPNKITQDDFKDWIQERGLYYPKTWDAGYRAPFAMSDAGEESLRGGLLTLDYGRGHYIYTSMVWYRQLRAGVPGAYRVFANMISYGHR